MEALRETRKKYCSHAMIIAISAAIVLIVIGQKALGKGLVLGTLFSIINFVLMAQMIPMRLANSGSKPRANAFAFLSILLRFPILAVPLVISLKVDAVDFIGVVVGLFMVQLTMLFNHLIFERLSSERKA